MAFMNEKRAEKLNMLLANSFTNLRNDILRINQRIDMIESTLANANLGAVRDLLNAQEAQFDGLKQAITYLVAEKEAEKRNAQYYAHENISEAGNGAGVGYSDKKQVQIAAVQFEAPGSDRENLNGEWVEIEGNGVNISGWMLCDKDNKHVFTFPEGFIINGRVKVFSGKGRNTSTKLFWKNPTPIWNNEDDVATLFDSEGNVISQVRSARVHDFEQLV